MSTQKNTVPCENNIKQGRKRPLDTSPKRLIEREKGRDIEREGEIRETRLLRVEIEEGTRAKTKLG